jgi:excinuclease UvrABC nuclease subunit
MSTFDLIDLQDDLRSYQITFNLWKKSWEKNAGIENFEWKTCQFDEKNREKIPSSPGLYSFVVNPCVNNHPHRYLCYIGKTEKSLRNRFGDYLREKEDEKGRPKIVRLLTKWDGFLEFSYVLLDRGNLKSLESLLIDIFLPPCNPQVSTKIYRITGAF